MRSRTNPLGIFTPPYDWPNHVSILQYSWDRPYHQNKTESHFNMCLLCGAKVKVLLNSRYITLISLWIY